MKSAKSSFGLAAFQRWADALTQPRDKNSWEKIFPAGAKMVAGLTSAFERFGLGTLGAGDDRELYADFLEEAGEVLGRPALRAAAKPFRASARGWRDLGLALLPENIAPLAETRELLERRRRLFTERGGGAAAEITAINDRLDALRSEMARAFPLTAAAVTGLREQIAAGVLKVGQLERAAYATLQAALEGEGKPARA